MSIYANYNSYGVTAVQYPYMLNQNFPASGTNDFTTEDSICTEFYLLFGSDITFIPRECFKEETTFGEYISSEFNIGYKLRLFVEEVEAFSGNGDMYSKFGLQVTDEATLYINKSSFLAQTNNTYPKQGDLLFHHVSNKLFQISHIENEIQPSFYRLGNANGFKFSTKLFSYSHELINQSASAGIPTAIQALDALLNDLDGNSVTLPQKDFNQNNKPIITTAIPLIDNSEIDLLG